MKIKYRCPICKKTFPVDSEHYRLKMKKQNIRYNRYCSRECAEKAVMYEL